MLDAMLSISILQHCWKLKQYIRPLLDALLCKSKPKLNILSTLRRAFIQLMATVTLILSIGNGGNFSTKSSYKNNNLNMKYETKTKTLV